MYYIVSYGKEKWGDEDYESFFIFQEKKEAEKCFNELIGLVDWVNMHEAYQDEEDGGYVSTKKLKSWEK